MLKWTEFECSIFFSTHLKRGCAGHFIEQNLQAACMTCYEARYVLTVTSNSNDGHLGNQAKEETRTELWTRNMHCRSVYDTLFLPNVRRPRSSLDDHIASTFRVPLNEY